MRSKWFAAAMAATVVVAGGAFAATGFGDNESSSNEGSGNVGVLTAHEAVHPAGAAASTLASPAKKKKGLKVTFLESDPVIAPFSGSLICPKGTKVIGGYHDTVGTVPTALSGSNPVSARKWSFDVDVIAFDTFQPQAFVGIVCLG